MNKTTFSIIATAALLANTFAVEFKPVPDWLKLGEGRTNVGNMHGDVAVSSKGEVYVSV